MNEAQEAVQLAAPFISYVFPAVAIISVLVVADYFTMFLIKLIKTMRQRVTFK
jgi:hypothetical protein